MKQLYTRWGKNLDPENVLAEYPRPLMVRESYINLNGYWDYAFTEKYLKPKHYEGQILVPFSPESALSGVGRQLRPGEFLWYHRCFDLMDWEEEKEKCRLLLHFGAVDQECVVLVNEKRAAAHMGGYLPFEADISDCVKAGINELVVVVRDFSDTSYHARGKQRLKRGGMFYTAQSGIWQTVWMEKVPKKYIRSAEAVPDLDNGKVRITVETEGETPVEVRVHPPQICREPMKMPGKIEFPEEEDFIEEDFIEDDFAEDNPAENGVGEKEDRKEFQDGSVGYGFGYPGDTIVITVPDAALWTCEEPWLYYFTVKMGEDVVESYFAMRKFSVEKDENGIPRICLNGKVQFQKGVLDQGYWPDGLYTAPSDEALIFDIAEMKKTGFNMVRKHVKIEPQRWYYHCDRLGIVVWQDMVNGGGAYKYWLVTYAATVMSSWRDIHIKDRHSRLLARKDKEGKEEFEQEVKETIRVLKGHPSIAAWVIFNEGWGQFDTEKLTETVRKADPTRLIDQASGWFDQGGGDLKSIHNYFFKLTVKREQERAAVLSEFGGQTLFLPEHSACEKLYGYGAHESAEEAERAYRETDERVQALIPDGLCASVYTQWSDIEEEVNGVYTYDREVRKIDGTGSDGQQELPGQEAPRGSGEQEAPEPEQEEQQELSGQKPEQNLPQEQAPGAEPEECGREAVG